MTNPNPKTDHLTPWVKGQSGNPGGISSAVHQMRQRTNEIMAKVQLAQAEKMLKDMEDSETPVIPEITSELTSFSREIADRVEGKPAQTIKGDADAPIGIMFRTFYEPKPEDAK